MFLSLFSVIGRTDEYVARPYGNGDFLIIPRKQASGIYHHKLPPAGINLQYVPVPPRRHRGGGARIHDPGIPGEIIENPYCRPPKPDVPAPTPKEFTYRPGMSFIDLLEENDPYAKDQHNR